ncbi:winged helix-turn-helix transcriptional regulator [Gordonia sp. DT30]|uniref:winged helix-turn-helix transcriptional regulator n=1 Tax=unclassified Gordonia (in: high G+C Gram-positive bacteria) TaxID=2657482 RepID=UPI003CEA2370
MKLTGTLSDRDSWRATECSIDKAVGVVGTRSALLILREAFYGATRFDEFVRRVGISEAVASARLRELTDAGIFVKVPYREPGQRARYEYQLTDAGRELLPVVLGLMQWGDRHLQSDGAPLRLRAEDGSPVRVEVRSASGDLLTGDDIAVSYARKRTPRPSSR